MKRKFQTDVTRQTPQQKNKRIRKHLAMHALAAMTLTVLSQTQADDTEQQYRTSEGFTVLPAYQPVNRTPSALGDLEPKPDTPPANGLRHRVWFEDEAWISGIGTLLYQDYDKDGYFAGFGLSIDADTPYDYSEVYATIDVLTSDTDRQRLHTTANFTIHGNSLADEYRVDIELLRNFPAGHYDIVVNLVNAYGGHVIDSVSAYDFSNLSNLPLESTDLNSAPNLPDTTISITHNADIRVAEYAGATGLWMLALLVVIRLIRLKWRAGSQQITSMPGQHSERKRSPAFILAGIWCWRTNRFGHGGKRRWPLTLKSIVDL